MENLADKQSSKKKLDQGSTQAMYAGEITFMDCPRVNFKSHIPAHSIVTIGVPFDTTTSNRPGTRFGPRGVRVASKLISWQPVYGWDNDLYGKENHQNQVFDFGDIDFDYGRQKSIFNAIDDTLKFVLNHQSKPLFLGGDHFISYPILKSFFKHSPSSQKIALVHFDAHSDTWEDEEGRMDHGTGFFHAIKEGIIDTAHSIQIGIRSSNELSHGIEVIDAFAAMQQSPKIIAKKIKKQVGDIPTYLTIDIDVLDAAFAPGTGTPTVGGLSTLHLLSILKELQGINFIGADMVEVSPPFDHAEITSLAGATIAAYQGHLLSKF